MTTNPLNYRPSQMKTVKPVSVSYPQCLGKYISKLPQYCRSQAWFDGLPEPIRRQFVITMRDFSLFVAAEYLADNHGTEAPKARIVGSDRADYLRTSDDVRGYWHGHIVSFDTPYGRVERAVSVHTPNWAYLAIAVRFVDIDGVRTKQILAVASRLQRQANYAVREKACKRGWDFANTELFAYRCFLERTDVFPTALGEVKK